MQNNKYTKLISLSLGVMIFSFIIGTALFAWREPAQVPPAGNVPAPINVGIIEQHKAGEIGAHRFEDSQNTSWFIDPNQPISAAFSGNVGIGTTAPGARLHVAGNTVIDGNVGIGTTAPGARLDVVGNILASTNVHDACSWQAWTCADVQSCPSGFFMTAVERGANAGLALCGTAPRQWYQMRILCCQI